MQTASKLAQGDIWAIDPGKGGGIAHFIVTEPLRPTVWRFPVDADGYDWPGLAGILDLRPASAMVVERTLNVRIGGRSNPAALASLVACVEGCRALAQLRGMPVVEVAPRTWQAEILPDGSAPTKDRATTALVSLGIRVRPWTDGTRDAVCIGLWALREMGVRW